MLSIIEAGIHQITLIQEIADKAWIPTYLPILGDEQVRFMMGKFYSTTALAEQIQHGQHFLIVKEGDTPVGFSSFTNEKEDGLAWRRIHKLYILPEYKNKGIGKLVLEYIKNPDYLLLLNVNRYNMNAIQFYKKNEFIIIREDDIDIGEGYFMNDYIMCKFNSVIKKFIPDNKWVNKEM